MKIFYFSQVNLKKHYSGAVHIKEVVREFADNGNDVLLFAQQDDDLEKNVRSVRVRSLGLIEKGIVSYLWYQCKMLTHALYLAIKERPDILYVRSESAMLAHVLVSKILRIPYFLELNNWPFRDFENVREVSRSMRILMGSIIGLSLKNSRGIICVTKEIARRLQEKYQRFDGVYAVENGVNVNLFKPEPGGWARAKLGINKNDVVLGFVAYFQYYNDAETAINAVKQLQGIIPGIKLLFVGGWAQQAHKEQAMILASNVEGNSVMFTDEVTYDNVPKYIGCFDIALALFNTDVGDGSVMKVYEYLSCSKPTIGSDISSLEFLKKDGIGTTVPLKDPDSLAEAVKVMLSDVSKAQDMAKKGLEYVNTYRTWKVVAQNINKSILMSLKTQL